MLNQSRDTKIDTITRSLATRFPDVDGDRIRADVAEIYDELADDADIERFVPVFTQRWEQEHLAEVTGHRPEIP